MRLNSFFGLLLPLLSSQSSFAQTTELLSPDKNTKLHIEWNKSLKYSVTHNNALVILPSSIDMSLMDGRHVTSQLDHPKISEKSVREQIISPVPEKRRVIPDHYNEATLEFRNGFSVTFRAYDDGIAYRISTVFKDSILVKHEVAEFNIEPDDILYAPEVAPRSHQDIYHTSFEEPYKIAGFDSVASKSLFFSPVLIAARTGTKIVVTESDLEGYPGMFLQKNHHSGLKGVFAPFPKTEKILSGLFSQVYVGDREAFISRSAGTRSFPWRVVMLASEDKQLPGNDLVYRLASPSRVPDVSWIQPRKSTEEWIITSNVFGVQFKSGVNTETYKYYIDFAKRFGFEQVLLDAGWSDNNDLLKVVPEIDMEELVRYAKSKHIKLGMWTLAMTLNRQLEEALDQFNRWGVDFIMTDFIERDDQIAVDFYHKIAKACAKHRIMIMYHGSFKPAGFNRTYPHALTREAVLGSEYNMWSAKATPFHNLLLPFIRMTSGPLDYEPGIMVNTTQKGFLANTENVMAIGTRTQQMAMFLIYDSPLQLFSGNPSQALKEPDFMELLGSLPTTWDTTIVLDARIGDYLVTARRKNDNWYIGAMCAEKSREITLSLDFLADKKYTATTCTDGTNANRYPADYLITNETRTKGEKLTIKMAPGGGFVMRLAIPPLRSGAPTQNDIRSRPK